MYFFFFVEIISEGRLLSHLSRVVKSVPLYNYEPVAPSCFVFVVRENFI